MAAGRPGTLPPLVGTCRPRQWTKNLLVFSAPLFAFRFEADLRLPAGGALVAFCPISSGEGTSAAHSSRVRAPA